MRVDKHQSVLYTFIQRQFGLEMQKRQLWVQHFMKEKSQGLHLKDLKTKTLVCHKRIQTMNQIKRQEVLSFISWRAMKARQFKDRWRVE